MSFYKTSHQMDNSKILIICNELGKKLFSKGIEILRRNNDIDLLIRPDFYSTDLRSDNYSIFRIVKKITNHRRENNFVNCTVKRLNKKFDYVLCLGYYQMSAKIINRIKELAPKCKTFIYFYDSFIRLDFSNDIRIFDFCATFDREDAKKHNIVYLPFFAEKYNGTGNKYDICHIGSWSPGHVYRVPVLNYFMNKYPNLKMYFRCTFMNINNMSILRKIKYILKLLHNNEYRLYRKFFFQLKDLNILTEKGIAYEQTIAIEANSKCIIEINAARAGLSPRVINALVNKRKVIINNPCIKNEIFYNENNIYVIDEKHPSFDIAFLEKPVIPFDLSDLEIGTWLKILFREFPNKYNDF